jgi:hypothetical protein
MINYRTTPPPNPQTEQVNTITEKGRKPEEVPVF